MAGKKAAILNQIITTSEACELLTLGDDRLRQLEAEGRWIERVAPGKWRVGNLVHGYISFLRDERSRAAKSAADSRWRDAKALEVQLKVQERARELIKLDDAVACVDAVVAAFRVALAGLPARASRDLRVRAEIDRAVRAMLSEVAVVLETQADRLTSGDSRAA